MRLKDLKNYEIKKQNKFIGDPNSPLCKFCGSRTLYSNDQNFVRSDGYHDRCRERSMWQAVKNK